MKKLVELKQKRASAITAQKNLIDAAGDNMTDEQFEQFRNFNEEIEGLDGEIQRAEEVEAAQKRAAQLKIDQANARGNGEFSKKEERELSSYSLLKAVRAKSAERQLSGFEAEMDQEARHEANQIGTEIDGFGIPRKVAVRMIAGSPEQRDMNAGTGADGGFFVPTDVDSSIITALRPKLVTAQAGARTLGNLTGNFDIPRNGGVSVAWEAENGDADETTPTISRVQLTPKRISAFTDVSKQLIRQSSPDVEALMRDDFFGAVASAIDAVAIEGGGSNEPTGILATSGIGAAYAGNAANNGVNADGAAPVYADLINLEKAVAAANGDISTLSYLLNPKVRGAFRKTEISNGSGRFAMEDNNMAAGYRAFTTTNVPSDLTKGSGTGLSAILFGDFSQLILAQWGGLDLIVNPYTRAKAGLVEMIVNQYVDVGVRHAESFAAIKDAVAS